MVGKRFLALFLVIFLLASMLPLPASAQEGAAFPVDAGLVSLSFTGGAGIDLSCLYLFDDGGNRVLPLSDAGGEYLLAPGTYSYYYLDPQNLGEELAVTTLNLDASQPRVEIPLAAAPAPASVPDPAELPAELPAPLPAEEAEDPTGAMPVVFRGGGITDFSGLTVFNAAGTVMQPYTEPGTGVTQYENYLLLPGQYAYYYHSPNGQLADVEGRFTVTASGMQTVSLEPAEENEGMCFSVTAVNPYYANVIRADSIPTPSVSPEESLEQLRREVDLLNADMSAAYYAGHEVLLGKESDEPWPTPVVYDTPEAAGAGLKRGLILRQKEIPICVRCSVRPTNEAWRTICWMLYDIAIRHSGVPTEGDYLRYEYGGANCNGCAVSLGKAGEYYYQFIYAPLYFTTLAQESELNARVTAILNELKPAEKSDVQKINAVYEYLCEHVTYTETGNTEIFTAYAALKTGTAACQGIAVAFYRLCLELGIDARVVTSREMGHAWNIVRADGRRYYAVDATWDAGKRPAQWAYFLKGSGNWLTEHALGDEFIEGKFDGYEFSNADYGGESGVTIHSASVLFDGMLRIRYYFRIPAWLLADRGACAQFSRDGSVLMTIPLTKAGREGEYCFFDCSVSAKAIADPVQVKILDGAEKNVLISSAGGTSYPNGVFFSAMDYARQMKTKASTAGMRILAQALEDYGIAAQNYFFRSGQTLREEVTAVTAANLAPWAAVTQGQKPAGFRGTAISAVFEADNSLRVYCYFENGVNPEAYRYEIDGHPAAIVRKADGSCYLCVDNIAVNELDSAHRFTISDGADSFSVTASVLSYAKTAIERGDADMANLGKALYLYNRAAENYFAE